MQENCVDIISSVPESIAIIILHFLDVEDLIRCGKCCKTWKKLAGDNIIWKRKCRQYNYREILENEENENYIRFCRKFSPHWKGVFIYHHNLRKNWLKKTISVYVNNPKQRKVLYFHHIDDKILVMQISDFSISIFNSSTMEVVKVFRGHTHCVNEVKMCGNVLVSSSMDSSLKAWNIDLELCMHSKWMEYDSIKFALSNDRIASTINNRILDVWGPYTGDVLFQIDNLNSISCIVTHASSILTGCVKGVVRIFSLMDGTLKNCIEIHSGKIKTILVKGLQAISVFKNFSLKIWNTADGSLLHTDKPRNNIPPISLDADRIAWTNSKCTIKIWDLKKGQTLLTVEHDTVIVAITANEDFLFCIDGNNMIVMWDLNTGELQRVFVIYSNRIVLSVHFFSATRTKLAMHTVGYTGNEETTSSERFLCNFDV